MSNSNVRSKSASPPPELDLIANVPHARSWFACKTFFLKHSYKMDDLPAFNTFTFEHSDDQCFDNVYDLEFRFWKLWNDAIYYIRTVSIQNDGTLLVNFVRKRGFETHAFYATFELDDNFMGLPNPFYQDNMPREHTINTFQQYTDLQGRHMPISHIVKFFNACLYLLIANSYRCDTETTGAIKQGFGEARLRRMLNIMVSTWDTYPGFAERYARDPTPIEDQQLCKINNPESSFGAIVVLLPLNKLAKDYLPFLKADSSGTKDLSEVEKWLSQGVDPLPILLERIPLDERSKYPVTIKTHDEFRW